LNPNPDYIAEAKKILTQSPYPAHMAMQLSELELDRAVVEIRLNENHLQPFGIVHGGVLATLIDTATYWAVFLRVPEDCGLVNIDLKLNYLKRAESGVLRAEGTAIKSGRTISYAEARVFDESGDILVHGTSTLMTMPGSPLPTKIKKHLT
jgi:uncharacterized protein (TIGR00369 family)